MSGHTLFAERALLPEGWRDQVLLSWNDAGRLTAVVSGAPAPAGVSRSAGPVLPGMPNLHSHAFQRAMAGLTEYQSRRQHPHQHRQQRERRQQHGHQYQYDVADSFWSWRNLMYRFAAKLTPELLEAIARQLYIEMLKAGYTSVCEFHYVHHDKDGRPYANPGELAECLIRAAAETGIGLTVLPVLYQHSGFGGMAPLPEQARFIASPEWILDLLGRLRRRHASHDGLTYGVAPHSLRAVSPLALHTLLQGLESIDPRAPVHIHIAEQMREVEECVAHTGARPVQWLLDNAAVDARWCLVHATHMDPGESGAVAASRAVVGLCPTTEANLGDGIFDAACYRKASGRWGIGSDSQISVSVREELRWLEYSQRFRDRRRNILADENHAEVADALYLSAVAGGAIASGRPVNGLAAGQRADFLVLDDTDPSLALLSSQQLLAGLVFCNHGGNPIRDVFVGGRMTIVDRAHIMQARTAQDFLAARSALLT